MFTRRFILKILGTAAAFLAIGGKDRVAGAALFKPKKSMLPRIAENRFVEKATGKALIGVSGAMTPYEMVEEAVHAIGGFGLLDIKGKTALVKPNVVSGEKHPATTNPEVVAAVVRHLYEHGASKVYVGDMSAMATLSTKRNMKRCGIAKAALDAGAELVYFEDYDWYGVEVKGALSVKTAYVTEWLYRADVIVNVPVVKTHRSASYTISLKNFIGCTHLKQRPYLIDTSRWEEIISEFNAAYAPDINIADATVSMVSGGPWSGVAEPTGLVIASGDRVGCDAFGLGLIKSFDQWAKVSNIGVWEQRQIKTALALGLGREASGLKLILASLNEEAAARVKKAAALANLSL